MKRRKVNIISGFFDVKMVNDFLNKELRDPSDNFYYEIINYDVNKFNDNEKSISFKKLNGDFVLIIQSLQCELLEEFLLKVQKVLATDKKIILVITYLCYLRQGKDLKEKLGEMIIKSLLNYENIIKIIVVDPHVKLNIKSDRYEEINSYDLVFYEINLKAYILQDCCILSPDKSSGKRNEVLAKKLNIDNIISDKIRDKNGDIISCKITNYKYHKTVFVVDDIIDTGNTVLSSVNKYMEMYKTYNINDREPIFFVYCTHGVLKSINKNLINNPNIFEINISSSYINSLMINKLKNIKSEDDLEDFCAINHLYKKIKIFDITEKIYEIVKKTLDLL